VVDKDVGRVARAQWLFAVWVALSACGRDDAAVLKAQAEAEKARAEAEKAKAEAEKAKAEAEMAKARASTPVSALPDAVPSAAHQPKSAASQPQGASTTAASGSVIEVSVAPQKSNGKAWDAAGGAPDIALCVSSGLGSRCLPNGTTIGSVTEPQCRDAFHCTFSVDLPAGDVLLDVLDVDLAVNDPIGSGHCARGRTCVLGQATVTIR